MGSLVLVEMACCSNNGRVEVLERHILKDIDTLADEC